MSALSACNSSAPLTKVEKFVRKYPELKQARVEIAWRGFIQLVAGHRAGPKDREIVGFLLSNESLPKRESLVFQFLNEVSRLDRDDKATNFEKLRGLIDQLLDDDLPVLEEACSRFKNNKRLVAELKKEAKCFHGKSFHTTQELQVRGLPPLRNIPEEVKEEAPGGEIFEEVEEEIVVEPRRGPSICKIITIALLALNVAFAASIVFNSYRSSEVAANPQTVRPPFALDGLRDSQPFQNFANLRADARTTSSTIPDSTPTQPIHTPSSIHQVGLSGSHEEIVHFKCEKNLCRRVNE